MVSFTPMVRLHAPLATMLGIALALGAAQPTAAASAAPVYDWLQFNGDPQHSGNNTRESVLTASNVATLTRTLHVSLPAVADGAPAVLTAVSTPSGTRDLLFLTTKAGHIVALDAHTGASVWSHQNGPGACHINSGSSACYTTSSPAVDPSRAFVYSYGLDGNVHKYAVGDGTEVTSGGWPELTTRKAFDEKGSSALSVATAANSATFLYVTHSGYFGDQGDYQGHVTAIRLSDGSQAVFNTLCSDQAAHFLETPATPDCAAVQSGVWARSGVVYDPSGDRILLATGNGNFVPSTHQWGDSVLAIHPDGSGAGGDPLDSFTPSNFAALQNSDTDLGSTAPAILRVPANSVVPHLAVQGGKDGLLRLLNLDNLSGQGGPGHTGGNVGAAVPVLQQSDIFTALASWTNPADGSAWIFVATASGIAGLTLSIDGSGNPSLAVVWQNANGGTSPIVANGVLYCASSGSIRGLNPVTGALLWQDQQIGAIHWESPVVANGSVYIADESGFLSAYGGVAAPVVPASSGPMVALLALGLLGAGVAGARGASRCGPAPQ
jgi:hypothetical protein